MFLEPGTESNNIAIHGIVDKSLGRNSHIITSKIEHASVLNAFKRYELMGNVDVDYISVDERGIVDLDELESKIKENTVLVSIMMVNNETGAIQPIGDISRIIKARNKKTVFHVDGVQAFGKLDINLKKLGVDMFSFSGHKIHALKGIGGLYIDSGIRIDPPFQGGGQEKGVRPGTENTLGIIALEKALSVSLSNRGAERSHIKSLKEHLIDRIAGEIPDVKINSPMEENVIDNVLSVSFPGTRGEILLHTLEEKEIYISTGSACSSKSKSKSHVLSAIGLSDEEIEGTLRISFSYDNTAEQIDYFFEALKEAVEDIRMIIKRR